MEESSILTSKSYKRAESNLKDKMKPTFLKCYPHYLLPGYNLHSSFPAEDSKLETVIEQYQEYPYHCDLPRPLLPPAKLPRCVLNEEDPSLELIMLKSYINDDVERMQQYFLKHEKELGLIRKKDVKWKQRKSAVTCNIPKYVANIAEAMDRDPDPYFKGVYNWYYTGGCIDKVQLHGTNILVFPFMGELVCVPFNNAEEFVWKPLLQKGSKCEINDLLYELKHTEHVDTCMILGRYKLHCNFYMLSERDTKCKLTEVHTEISKVPYTSADLSQINANQYCTVDVDRNVTMWDLTKMKPLSSYSILLSTVVDDFWSSLKFQLLDPNVLLFEDRCCLHYLDIRLPFDRPVLTVCPKFYLEKCEQLSLDIASRNQFCRYLGTSHSVLMCDNRSPKQCIQQKWTHQFKSPPLLGQVIEREDKEFIVLSSQIPSETTIIVNSWSSNGTSHSYNFPYTPPHIKETLNESQMQGMCLNPYLRDRFELSNIGSFLIQNETQDIFLFLQNSIGDIYYQCITHNDALDKYSFINGKSCCILNEWESAISSQIDTVIPLTMSTKSNMQHLFKCFTNKKLRLKYDKSDIDDCFDPSWKQSLERLNSYMDILAPELLAVWEICEEVPLSSATAPHQKVLSWLEYTDARPPVSTQELENVPTQINSQELISVSQEPDVTYLDDINALQDLLPKVKTARVRKKDARKRPKIR